MTDAGPVKLSQLRRIAFRTWDPIGMQPADPARDDEYDAYLLHVVNLLELGTPAEAAAVYLVEIESDHMGLGLSSSVRERAQTTVAAIRAYIDRLRSPLQRIELDASAWRVADDVWRPLLHGVVAPPWHGFNYDALWEAITETALFGFGPEETINRLQPPFEIIVRNAASLPSEVRERLDGISTLFAKARAEYDMEVSLQVLS